MQTFEQDCKFTWSGSVVREFARKRFHTDLAATGSFQCVAGTTEDWTAVEAVQQVLSMDFASPGIRRRLVEHGTNLLLEWDGDESGGLAYKTGRTLRKVANASGILRSQKIKDKY